MSYLYITQARNLEDVLICFFPFSLCFNVKHKPFNISPIWCIALCQGFHSCNIFCRVFCKSVKAPPGAGVLVQTGKINGFPFFPSSGMCKESIAWHSNCLLYTSDAADDL